LLFRGCQAFGLYARLRYGRALVLEALLAALAAVRAAG
jgi:hypothetical protein